MRPAEFLPCLPSWPCCSYGAPASLEAYYQQVGHLCGCAWLCTPACCWKLLSLPLLRAGTRVRPCMPAYPDNVSANTHLLMLCWLVRVAAAQAGRAGRDGVQSTCVLLWSAADAAKNAIIKVCGCGWSSLDCAGKNDLDGPIVSVQCL